MQHQPKIDDSVKPQTKHSIAKTFGLVAILTIFSKFGGLLRDIVVLDAFGTSVYNDAYNFAYLMTGHILILFGGLGGPFHSAIVSVLTPRKDSPDFATIVKHVFLITMLILAILAALLYLIAPLVIPFIFPAADHDITYRQILWEQIAVQVRIMSPLLVIAGSVGIAYGVLNIFNKVTMPSLSPLVASLAIIALVLLYGQRYGAIVLAWGTLLGAIGQLCVQLPQLFSILAESRAESRKQTTQTQQSLKSPDKKPIEKAVLKGFFFMLVPAMVSTSIGQLNVYVDAFFTSGLPEGSWTAIFNANKLIQLPLGVLVTAMLVPILPRFTQLMAEQKVEALKEELLKALRFLWFLSLPIEAIFLAIPDQIIALLFQRGQFNANSTQLVTTALVFLAPMILFYIARDIITRVFYAQQDSTTPFRVALMAIIVNFIFDAIFVKMLGIGGITLSTTLVTVFNLSLLSYFLRKKLGNLGFTKLAKPLAIMIFAALICGVVSKECSIILSTSSLLNCLPGQFIKLLLQVGISSLTGLGSYVLICLLLKMDEINQLVKRIKKSSV